MGEELIQAFKLIDIDDRVRCVVVTGHGRNFCAGQDLGPEHGFKGGKERVNDHRDLYVDLFGNKQEEANRRGQWWKCRSGNS